MTRDLYAAELAQCGALASAALARLRAARVEGASRRRVQWIGHLTLHRGAGTAGLVHLGDGVEQHAGVGVLRL